MMFLQMKHLFNKLILFVSDLHLGNGGPADDFGPSQLNLYSRDHFFIQWLNELGPDYIFWVGDIFELAKFTWRSIKTAHPRICNLVAGTKSIYIPGNHDINHGLLYPSTRILSFPIEGELPFQILVSHAYQNSWFMRSDLSRYLAFLLGIPERIHPSLNDHKSGRVIAQVGNYVKGYMGQVDAVVTGHDHTHHISTYENDGNIVGMRPIVHADCGDCMHGKFKGIAFHSGKRKLSRITS